jgi:hypothetical protein
MVSSYLITSCLTQSVHNEIRTDIPPTERLLIRIVLQFSSLLRAMDQAAVLTQPRSFITQSDRQPFLTA